MSGRLFHLFKLPDEKARYTDESLVALNSSGFSAIHIPERYDGQGGDSIAACSSSKRLPGCAPRRH